MRSCAANRKPIQKVFGMRMIGIFFVRMELKILVTDRHYKACELRIRRVLIYLRAKDRL